MNGFDPGKREFRALARHEKHILLLSGSPSRTQHVREDLLFKRTPERQIHLSSFYGMRYLCETEVRICLKLPSLLNYSICSWRGRSTVVT